MYLSRFLATGVALLVSATLAVAADAPKPNKPAAEAPKPNKPAGAGGIKQDNSPLLPAEALAKLNLTAEQQTQIKKLADEFSARNQATQDKAREELAKLQQEGQAAKQKQDKAALKQLQEKAQGIMQEASKLRGEYLGKVAQVLTEEQKKTLGDAIRSTNPAAGKKPEKTK